MNEHMVSQAVILAGGMGTRLSPLTDIRPKGMVSVGGRPFIDYLLLQVAGAGISEVLILTGYRGSHFESYLSRSAEFGIKIKLSYAPLECDTGERLRRAASILRSRFLLLYCDNFAPLDLAALVALLESSSARCVITAYLNNDSYTTSNLEVSDCGRIVNYVKDAGADESLTCTDIGYAVVEKTALCVLPHGNPSLERDFFPRLIKGGELYAFVTRHRHYGIGNFKRLSDAHMFFSRRKYVLLDRDGVLNVKPPRGEYIRRISDWRWTPFALEGLRILGENGIGISLVTNQAGISRGMVNPSELSDLHSFIVREASLVGAHIDAVYVCPHHWDDDCDCRKPKPGLIHSAQKDLALFLPLVPFVGDSDSDEAAACSAGCPFYRIDENHSLLDISRELVDFFRRTSTVRFREEHLLSK